MPFGEKIRQLNFKLVGLNGTKMAKISLFVISQIFLLQESCVLNMELLIFPFNKSRIQGEKRAYGGIMKGGVSEHTGSGNTNLHQTRSIDLWT